MYGNREGSVLDDEVPEVPGEPVRKSDAGLDPDSLSESERARLRAATRRVRRAVEDLVPQPTEVDSRLSETPNGYGGIVLLQAPGMPPIGTAVEPDASALEGSPVLTDEEVREQATDLVAQAVTIARGQGLDTDGMPAQ